MHQVKNGQNLAAALLLVFMAILAGGSARRESVTIDEVAHTAAGVSYLQKLDLRMNEEHPPLAKVLAAVPLVMRGVHADYSHLSWTFSSGIFTEYLGEWVFGHWFLMRWNDPYSTLFWARVPMLLLTLLLGFVIYVCGTRLGGGWGGLLCLVAFVTTPAFLTFGPLVLTDVAVTLFWVLTTWQLSEMWHSPSRGTGLKFGLSFAGALLSKFSAGLLFFVFFAVALSTRVRPLAEQPADKLERRRWRRHAWWNIGKGTLWAAVCVYVVYFVLSWHQPTDSFNFIPHFPVSPVLRRLLMPPWLFLQGVLLFAVSAGSRPTYILGHAYPHGVWFYFPALFLLKSQLAFLVLVVVATVAALMIRFRRSALPSPVPAGMELRWRCLWISLSVFTVACLLSQLDLSIRHFLPALALITLMLAPLPRMLTEIASHYPRLAKAGIGTTVAMAFALIVSAARAYPNYLPYLNSLGMGKPGFLLVNDSNLDWNQALPEVEKFAESRGMNKVLLDEYAFSDPDAWVRHAEIWSCQEPSPSDAGQWVIVSGNNFVDAHNCVWLEKYPREEIAGGSMYAVRLPEVIPAAGTPGGPPLPEDYRYIGGIGKIDMRTIFMNCIHDPRQMQPTLERMERMGQEQRQKSK